MSIMLKWPLQFNLLILTYVLKVSREINLSEVFTLFPYWLPIVLHNIKFRFTLFCHNKLVLTGTYINVNFSLKGFSILTARLIDFSLQMYNLKKIPINTLECMNVILLQSNQHNYSVLTHTSIMRWHIIIVFIFLFSPPWWWSHEWPKHVGDSYIHSYTEVYLLVLYLKNVTSD